ncbi:hypothetical protein ACHAWF_004533 [Thalassiosira exigua]
MTTMFQPHAVSISVAGAGFAAEPPTMRRSKPRARAKNKNPNKKKFPASASASASASAAGPRPYNRYNLYFILERESQVLARGGTTRWSSHRGAPRVPPGYERLNLPPLPPRFAHLDVPEGWCLPGPRRKEKRPHRKTHGVASFKDMAKDIGKSWKEIDEATKGWCAAVEKILKRRHDELKRRDAAAKLAAEAADGRGRRAGAPEVSTGPTAPVSWPETPEQQQAAARRPRRASAPASFLEAGGEPGETAYATLATSSSFRASSSIGDSLASSSVRESAPSVRPPPTRAQAAVVFAAEEGSATVADVLRDLWSRDADPSWEETAGRGAAYVSDDQIRMWYME